MSEIKLLPCPFCGGEAELVGDKYHWVLCKDCKGGSHAFENVEEAIEKWNTRKPMQEQSQKFTNEFMFEEKLQEIVYWLEKKINPLHNVNWNSAIDEAIEIVKEVGGMND